MLYGIIYGIILMVSFLFGLKTGLALNKGKEISLNPINIIPKTIEKVREIKQEVETNKEIEKMSIINDNINNFDGTGRNQKKVGV